jgi:hypothetical protein
VAFNQQAGGFIWCTSCCESAPAARLLDEDIMPRHGIWDAMQDFKVLKSSVCRHFEGGRSAAHKLKAQAAAAQAKRDAESPMVIAMRFATIALNPIVEGSSCTELLQII